MFSKFILQRRKKIDVLNLIPSIYNIRGGGGGGGVAGVGAYLRLSAYNFLQFLGIKVGPY